MTANAVRVRLAATVLLVWATPPAAIAQRGGPPPAMPTQADVLIPMRDGVQLGADIYLPSGSGPFPVLLTLTPYGKTGAARTAAAFTPKGYAVVAVDSRGLRASHGTWEPCAQFELWKVAGRRDGAGHPRRDADDPSHERAGLGDRVADRARPLIAAPINRCARPPSG